LCVFDILVKYRSNVLLAGASPLLAGGHRPTWTFAGTRDDFIDWVGLLLHRQAITMHLLANITVETGVGDDRDAAALEACPHDRCR